METCLRQILKLLKDRWFERYGWLLLLVVLLAGKSVYLVLAMGLHYGRNYGGVYTTFFFTVFLALFLNLIVRHRASHAIWLGSLLIGMLLHADLLYFRFYGEPLAISMMSQVGNLGAVSKSIFTLPHASDLIFYADLPFWLWFALRRPTLSRLPKRALLLGLLLSVAFFFVRHENLPAQRVIYSFSSEHYQTTDLIEMGILHYHIQDVGNFIWRTVFPEPQLTAEQQREVAALALRPMPEPGPMFGQFAGKNVLVIQMESLQSFMIGKSFGGQEITPFLNRLAGESLFFTNFYHQTGSGRTSDAEILTMNAFYGLPKGVAFWGLRHNQFVSLPKILQAEGYDTFSMHGNSGAFYGRLRTHQSLGFGRSYFEADLDARDRIGMGISDKAFFAQAVDVVKQAKRPFYGFLISLSCHHPFDDPFPLERPFQIDGLGGLGHYLQAVRYSDEALERFFSELEAHDLLKDTIVAVYGDHHGVGASEQRNLETFLGEPLDELAWLEMRRVPLMIRLPNGKGQTIEGLAGQIDLAPTLASLLGIREPIFFALGEDLLSDHRKLLVFRDGSWIDEHHASIVGASGIGTTVVERASRRPVPIANHSEAMLEAERRLWLSDQIMNHNLMARLNAHAKTSASRGDPTE